MKFWAIVSLTPMMLMGCASNPSGSSHIWEQTEEGGVLSLHGDDLLAEQHAYQRAAMHCGGPSSFKVVWRGTVVLRQEKVETFQEATVQRKAGDSIQQEEGKSTTNTTGPSTGLRKAPPGSPARATRRETTTERVQEERSQERSVSQTGATRVETVRDVTENRLEYRCVVPASPYQQRDVIQHTQEEEAESAR